MNAAEIDQARGSAISYLQGFGTRAASDALGVVQTVLGTLIDAVLVLILSIYIEHALPQPRRQREVG
jgi:hypothetical protein